MRRFKDKPFKPSFRSRCLIRITVEAEWPWRAAFRCTPARQCTPTTEKGVSGCAGMAHGGPSPKNRLRKIDGELYEYTPKRGVTFTLTAADLVRRLVALVPPAKTHLTSFHRRLRPPRRASPPGDLRALTTACRAETEAAQSHQSQGPEARLGLASPAYVRP